MSGVGLFASGGTALLSLRLSPLIASTAFITGVIDQQIAWTTLPRAIPRGSRPEKVGWLSEFVWNFVTVCAITYPVTIILLGLNLVIARNTMSEYTTKCYGWGFALTVIHCFPYKWAREIRKACWTKDLPGEEGFESLKYFTDRNGPRIWILDIPAWFCILGAVLSHFKQGLGEGLEFI